MAKLYFYYASMNAGKSTTLLQANFNYNERGMRTMLWTAAIDDRSGERGDGHAIESRIGLHASACRFSEATDLLGEVKAVHAVEPLSCVLVDEAQFLTPRQVWQCADLADKVGIPVLCYGLRTDFRGDLFPGSAVLLGIADTLVELKGVCHCGRKASMNLRVDDGGMAVSDGAQTEIGGNDRYVALCRRHFSEALGR
ncbi:thymidine kinase [Novosphingobium mangrovi (ex Huang et al. 2023)]|uniref:Thymidine kinase n=1 Tax=Novosphingobium mangrovi (ex Huang et al. 2023) TaxID=2976432 RepID=A0ABT2I208_9SPHN|nr:thymidine kinase [Novosphingobium mangrovi (ex Huang et al. 2023)]MCT2398835.1 thymidine kinase [Novosphingobium mangrovi (ex Huang et al. 2023)]